MCIVPYTEGICGSGGDFNKHVKGKRNATSSDYVALLKSYGSSITAVSMFK